MDTLFTITFPTMAFPISPRNATKLGHWTHYQKAWDDNKTTLTVTPRLEVRKLTDFPPTLIYRDLNLFFEPKDWDVARYGLIYTDPVFEEAVITWWQNTCKFPESYGTPFYTEQGMQTDDTVSMELKTVTGDHGWWAGFHSAHEAMEMLKANPTAKVAIT